MIIYIDVMFLENFILDFIIIFATSIICNMKVKLLRLTLASIIGSLGSIVCIILNLNEFIIKIFLSFIIIFVAFKNKNIKTFFRCLGVFYLVTIVFGGASFLFLFLVNPEKIVYKDGFFLGAYAVKMTLLGVIFGFVLIISVQKMLKKKFVKICDIEIGYRENKVCTKALVDSRKFIKRKYFKSASYNCRKISFKRNN